MNDPCAKSAGKNQDKITMQCSVVNYEKRFTKAAK